MIFFLFHIEIEGKGGWIIAGDKGYVGPTSQIIWGPAPAPPGPPLPTPMHHHDVWTTLDRRCNIDECSLGSILNGSLNYHPSLLLPLKRQQKKKLAKCVDLHETVHYIILSYDVAVIQWITSCHKNRKTTRVMTLWRVSVMCFLIKIMFILKTMKSRFEGPKIKRILHSW